MNNEISEEAKKSLANAARNAAFRRLERDGVHSTAALQRRVRALAEERNIPTADIHKLMYKKPSTHSVMVFCEKYKVSYDWILRGGPSRLAENVTVGADGSSGTQGSRQSVG